MNFNYLYILFIWTSKFDQPLYAMINLHQNKNIVKKVTMMFEYILKQFKNQNIYTGIILMRNNVFLGFLHYRYFDKIHLKNYSLKMADGLIFACLTANASVYRLSRVWDPKLYLAIIYFIHGKAFFQFHVCCNDHDLYERKIFC